jgi:hypothetical protein
MDASHCTASSSVSPLAPAEESEGAAKRMRAEVGGLRAGYRSALALSHYIILCIQCVFI